MIWWIGSFLPRFVLNDVMRSITIAFCPWRSELEKLSERHSFSHIWRGPAKHGAYHMQTCVCMDEFGLVWCRSFLLMFSSRWIVYHKPAYFAKFCIARRESTWPRFFACNRKTQRNSSASQKHHSWSCWKSMVVSSGAVLYSYCTKIHWKSSASSTKLINTASRISPDSIVSSQYGHQCRKMMEDVTTV